MTKPLDLEVIALRAVERAIEPLPVSARIRVLEYVCARALNLPGFNLESGRKNARMAEALRWVRKESSVNWQVRDLIDRALAEAEAKQ